MRDFVADVNCQPNSPIPTFSLPDQDGQLHTPAEYTGKWLLIYFYPKDDTPGCTVEACSFRDQSKELQKAKDEFLAAIKADPGAAQPHYLLARVYRELHDTQASAGELSEFERLSKMEKEKSTPPTPQN